jgi:hypothetical protein
VGGEVGVCAVGDVRKAIFDRINKIYRIGKRQRGRRNLDMRDMKGMKRRQRQE